MEQYKVDIRFLILSVLFHLALYGLFCSYKPVTSLVQEPVQITLDDGNKEAIHIAPHINQKEPPKTQPKQAHYLADQQQRFDKETVSPNLGIAQNEAPREAQQKRDMEQRAQTEKGPSLLPVISNQPTNQEARRSSIDFIAPNVSKGDVTFLNSDFYTYASFYNRISPSIVYHWSHNIEDIAMFPHIREMLLKKYKWVTHIELILDKKGYYKNVTVLNSSGSPELDQAVVNALRAATPFLNPPTGMVETDSNVHIEGEFTIYTQRPRLAE
jgi:protein TonB